MTHFKTFNVLLLIGSIIVAIILFKNITIATFLIIVLTGIIYNTSATFINTNVATEHKDKPSVQESYTNLASSEDYNKYTDMLDRKYQNIKEGVTKK
jgi:hypothetical protein